MNLDNWKFDLRDLDDQNEYVENPEMSVMANAVEFLNTRLLKSLPDDTVLLEIGCGSYSLLKNNMSSPAVWEGIDVIDVDRRGKPSVATHKASVEDIPWPDRSFDVVVSNQSIEHWYEYGVDVNRGLSEIRRTLKEGGRAVINFPIHLHGQKMFVLGDFAAIDDEFASAGLDIVSRVAVIKSGIPQYKGWRLCGFPDFLIRNSPGHEDCSYVVEYEAERSTKESEYAVPWVKKPSLNAVQRQLHYGLPYLAWKVVNWLFRRARER